MQNVLDHALLEAALTGLETQKARIEEYISSVRSQLGVRGPGRPKQAITEPLTVTKKRRLSAAGRKRVGEAARRRWAAVRAEQEVAAAPPPRKRKLSAAGRAAIVAALKKRWAAKKAATKKPKQLMAKKVTAKAVAKKAPAKVTKKTAKRKRQTKTVKSASSEAPVSAQ